MRGEFAGVKDEIFREVFERLLEAASEQGFEMDELGVQILFEALPTPFQPIVPSYKSFNDDGELFLPDDLEARSVYEATFADYQKRIENYNDASVDGGLTWAYIQGFFADDATTEKQLVVAIEKSFEPIDDVGGDALSNEYFQLVERFNEKFSLRYELRRPSYARTLSLHPTLPGLFTRLLKELKESASKDPALSELMRDFEEAVIDLRVESSSRRIKQCISAQFNLFEAILSQHPDVSNYNESVVVHNADPTKRGKQNPVNTFGAMCDKVKSWPHKEMLNSVKSLYKFASDTPGIRHGGTHANQIREIDMRDMVSMAIILAGFSPYLNASLNADFIYSD